MIAAVTDWIPGDQKPTIVGVYERQLTSESIWFSRWDGVHWCFLSNDFDTAATDGGPSFYQREPWRGLASDPKGTK